MLSGFQQLKEGDFVKSSATIFTLPVISLILLSFILGTSEFIIVGILPDISEGLNVSLALVGNLVSLFAFAYAIGTPFITIVSSRFNRLRLLMFLVAVFILGNLLCGFSTSYAVLVLARIVTAVVSGALLSIGMTFAKDITEAANMPKVIAWIFSGFSIASIVGVPIGTALAQFMGWRYVFFIICIVSVFVALLLYKTLPKQGSVIVSKNLTHQFILFKDVRIILGVLIVFFGAAASYVFYTYLTPILETELGVPVEFVSIVLLLFGVTSIISNLISGRIASSCGMEKMPKAFLIQTICLAFLPLTTLHSAAGLINIFALGVLMYLMNSSIQMHFLNIASQKVPESINLASSLSPVSFNFGIALGSVCGSIIVTFASLRYVGICGALFAFLAFAITMFLNAKSKRLASDN